ncbi:hypothetical protein HDU83_005675 [Entophlyctis luteolus]|nr:hypothetical protein HDU83_005675 [Entophlyctis luteolus]
MSAFASASRPGPVAADPDPHALVHAIYARLLFVEARLAELSRFIQPLLVSSDEHQHQLHQQPLQLPAVHLLHQARQEQEHLEHPEPQQQVDPKQPEPLPPAQPQSQVVQLSDSAVVRPPMLPIEAPTTLPAESDPIILVARNPQANTSSPSLGRVGPTWFSFDAGDDDLRYRDRDALFSESDESDCSLRRNIDSSPMLDVGGGTDWIHGANHNDNSPMILAHTDNECEREEHGTNRPKGKSLPCKGKRRTTAHGPAGTSICICAYAATNHTPLSRASKHQKSGLSFFRSVLIGTLLAVKMRNAKDITYACAVDERTMAHMSAGHPLGIFDL